MDYDLTTDDVNRWQAESSFHPLTCRYCRGWGDCGRRDVGNVKGDHHVLLSVEFADGLGLICECCGETQDIPAALEPSIRAIRDDKPPGPWPLL